MLHMDSYHPIHMFSSKKISQISRLNALALLKPMSMLLAKFCYLIWLLEGILLRRSKLSKVKSGMNIEHHLKNQIPKPSPPKYDQSSLIIHSLIKYYLNYMNKLLLPVADPCEPVEGDDFFHLKFFSKLNHFNPLLLDRNFSNRWGRNGGFTRIIFTTQAFFYLLLLDRHFSNQGDRDERF